MCASCSIDSLVQRTIISRIGGRRRCASTLSLCLSLYVKGKRGMEVVCPWVHEDASSFDRESKECTKTNIRIEVVVRTRFDIHKSLLLRFDTIRTRCMDDVYAQNRKHHLVYVAANRMIVCTRPL